MQQYYPAQILPLKVKLDRLPQSAYERYPDVMARMAICDVYTVCTVHQNHSDVEVVLSAEGKPDVRLAYQFDQVVYVRHDE
jgi:hypothetical protein